MVLRLPLVRSLGIAVFAFCLAGCAGSNPSTDDPGTITVWHWMSDRQAAFDELARRYEAETGTAVRFELYAPSVAYEQKVMASLQTGTLPDIFGILGQKRDFANFVLAGVVEELTGKVPTAMLVERAVESDRFAEGNEFGVPPGLYGVPLDVMTIKMLYNKDLYAKAGLDPERPPLRWEEFISHVRRLREHGIGTLAICFGELWMVDAFASDLAVNLMGQEKYFDTLRGKVPYTDGDWLKLFGLFKRMADEKALVDGAVTMVNKSAEQTFANGQAAYAFNGSWSVHVYKGMNPDLNYAAILPPRPTDAHPMLVWSAAGSSFSVNAASPRHEAAARFLAWLTEEPQQAYLAEQTENLPVNKNVRVRDSKILLQFAEVGEGSMHPSFYPVHELPAVSEAFAKGIQSILIGDKAPEAVATDVQEIKEKEMVRQGQGRG